MRSVYFKPAIEVTQRLSARCGSNNKSAVVFALIFLRCPFSTFKEEKMTHCATRATADGSRDIGDAAWKAKLTVQQFHVLRMKGTDPRFGRYDNHFEPGEYYCAGCDALLYTSEMKFRCTCGWPAFWDCVPLAVREEADADGMRMEILCNACNSHLGHVFCDEGFHNPAPNERHCVNSTAICFRPRQGA